MFIDVWMVGIAGLVAAGVCAFLAYRSKRRVHAMVTTETYTVRELRELATASAQAAGEGVFELRCEVVGKTRPGESGVLRSELGRRKCVWHAHRVTREYWVRKSVYDHNTGGRKTVSEKKSEVVSERRSEESFMVEDATGRVPVRVGDVDIDGKIKAVDRYEPAKATKVLKIGNFRLPLEGRSSGGTIGFRYEEWILPVGVRTYVLGTARDASGRIEITDPSIVSTRDEQQLIRESRGRQRTYSLVAAGCAVVGAALLVFGLLS